MEFNIFDEKINEYLCGYAMLDFMSIWETYNKEDKAVALDLREFLNKEIRPHKG